MSENNEITMTEELIALKARADLMGLTYHPSIGYEKLREKVAAALTANTAAANDPVAPAPIDPVLPLPPVPPVADVAPVVAEETVAQRRKRMKMQATELVRIRLTCMNPAKKEWDGEIFATGNSLVGTLKRFIPFNADEGWHVPWMMYQQLKDRQCQVFTSLKTKNGVTVRQGKLIKEFAIELLPPLTTDALHDLAQRQALAQSVG